MTTSEIYLLNQATGERIDLGEKCTIGRSESCDIWLQVPGISRSHGFFEIFGEQVSYTDLGSSNGSYVNGQKVLQTQLLYNGDVLVVGECKLEMHSPDGKAIGSVDSSGDATAYIDVSDQKAPDLPAMWSDSGGLESASQTKFVQVADRVKSAVEYQKIRETLPPLGENPRLVVVTDALRGQIFDLNAVSSQDSQSWTVGRDPGSDITLADDSVSGQHAQIVHEGQRWKVVNWMSTNGTYVNGKKGLSTYLSHGDMIGVGNVTLVFELPDVRGNKGSVGKGKGLIDRVKGILRRWCSVRVAERAL